MNKLIDEKKVAVALKYPENAPAPFVTAKGNGKLAEFILEEAKKNNIEIIDDSPLVDVLSSVDIGNCIPEETWNAVAAIFSFILK